MAQMPLARAQLGAQRKAGEREGKVSKLPRVGSWGGLGTGPKVWNQDLRTFQSAGVAAPTEGRAPTLEARLPPIPRRAESLSARGMSCSESHPPSPQSGPPQRVALTECRVNGSDVLLLFAPGALRQGPPGPAGVMALAGVGLGPSRDGSCFSHYFVSQLRGKACQGLHTSW